MASKTSPAEPSLPTLPELATVEIAERDGAAFVTLNRPDVHNAFDETLIRELTEALAALGGMPRVRAVVLTGAGPTFCAGADLGWMRRMADYDYERNVADAGALARLLQSLASLPKPTIARVHGPTYGGGVGLVACCDIAIAAHESSFALSEAKLGLIPATIGPYVVEAMGARAARRYMLTGERFDAAEALRTGLVHAVAESVAELEDHVEATLEALLLAGPHAQAAVKALVRAVAHRPIDERVIADTAERIATVRASDEGREGIDAFLTRRAPAWVQEASRGRKRS